MSREWRGEPDSAGWRDGRAATGGLASTSERACQQAAQAAAPPPLLTTDSEYGGCPLFWLVAVVTMLSLRPGGRWPAWASSAAGALAHEASMCLSACSMRRAGRCGDLRARWRVCKPLSALFMRRPNADSVWAPFADSDALIA